MEEIEINRTRILAGDYIYPEHLVTLVPTKHVLQRLEERGIGFDWLPTIVRITRDNIYSAKTYDGKHLHSVVVRLSYTRYKWMFLCFNPFDGGVKTIWFRDVKRSNNKKSSRQTVPDDRREDHL